MNDTGKTHKPQHTEKVLSRRDLLKIIPAAVLVSAAAPALLAGRRPHRAHPDEAVSQIPERETLLHGARWCIPH